MVSKLLVKSNGYAYLLKQLLELNYLMSNWFYLHVLAIATFFESELVENYLDRL